MTVLVMIGQLILGLSILVALHELGHLIAAKVFGMKVEQYSIGFPPKIWGKQIGETEYSIGAIPMGGFVKIAGMIDESMDVNQMKEPPQSWEFRSKPAWQRLIVMLGGIFVNVVTGIIIFSAILYIYGETFTPMTQIKGIVTSPLAKEIGLMDGDKIVKINGKKIDYFEDIRSADAFLGTNSYYIVERKSEEIKVSIPENMIEKLGEQDEPFVAPMIESVVESIEKETPAEKAGLKVGDKIIGINKQIVSNHYEVKKLLANYKSKEAEVTVLRKNDTLALKATPDSLGRLGFYPFMPSIIKNYSLGESVVMGTSDAFKVVYDNIKGLSKVFTGKVRADKALSGPFEIASKFYGGIWIWKRFWLITGMLSMALAFMNILPIPALDGGHTVFLLYEIITGKAPSDKFLENAQRIGMVILLSLMAFVILNGAYKTIIKNLF